MSVLKVDVTLADKSKSFYQKKNICNVFRNEKENYNEVGGINTFYIVDEGFIFQRCNFCYEVDLISKN